MPCAGYINVRLHFVSVDLECLIFCFNLEVVYESLQSLGHKTVKFCDQ
jgi:hypothetical protein